MAPPTPAVALTIAGSDSGGAAGIQADLQTFAAFGVFGCSVLAALTAQNSVGVHDVHVPPVAFLQAQLDAVLDDLPVAAVKTGMLATAEVVEVVAQAAADGRLPALVVDPVMVASTGAPLMDDDAVAVYRDELLPRAVVATPNLWEAQVLLDTEIRTLEAQRDAARRLAATGPSWVVVTGGHPVDDRPRIAVDVIADRDTGAVTELPSDRIDTANTHGSGCAFSSAVAAGLARGRAPDAAIADAHAWIAAAIARSATWQLGAGHGPLDLLPAPRGTP